MYQKDDSLSNPLNPIGASFFQSLYLSLCLSFSLYLFFPLSLFLSLSLFSSLSISFHQNFFPFYFVTMDIFVLVLKQILKLTY